MLAIVIPYYKLTFFEETLESLSNQTDKYFKVYIGDDASPESPKDLLEKYEGKFNFIYHRFEENIGKKSLVSQWDRCIALSKEEEWIMILGDDDLLGSSVVASWYENYNVFNGSSNVVRFASKKIFEKLISVPDIFVHPVWEKATDSFYRKFDKMTRSSLSEYIFSKASYLKHGFYDYPLAWASDDRAWLDFSDNKPIFTINESVVFFRLSSVNISGRQDNILIKNVSEIEFFKFIVKHKLGYYDKNQRLRLLRRYMAEIRKTRNLKISEFFFILFFSLKYFDVDWLKKGYRKAFDRFIKKGIK